ncbi:Serine/threonine-protein kinase PknB [Pirellulimonas nuda]|uniref:non-specific serine/threonine protein kinase n=1 Tax=Pirellulimonas nuda TaxID=2528009 RepID=A0A518DCA0_9BACT|nr:serine/threonine-protein kinase [Pirellulimonas nuda]QDU89107.1 Serine/threonine-protein kinase PknB [Pirellulimonas nuda]
MPPSSSDGRDEQERSPQEQENFELLDRFQQAIDAGDEQACRRLLADHTHHNAALQCLLRLGRLERLSAPVLPDVDSPTRTYDTQTTLSPSALRLTDGPLPFGKYRLLEQVGRGGMGAVFRAEQPDLQREVAVKIILGGGMATEDQVRRFHQEAQAAACLRHPNVVAIHDVGFAAGMHYIAMEYMPGGSLAQRLKCDGRIREDAAQIALEVARAVDHLHQRGVIHRDLKPSNIMFDDADRPCLTDFGLAKLFEADSGCTRTGDVLGTASYMSPEQASGMIRVVSPLSDVYSVGAILYEMLVGRPPFVGENFVETILRVLEGEPVPPRRLRRDVDPELQQICMRCLEKRPEDRYASAAELAGDLERFVRGEPIETRMDGLSQSLRRNVRRRPALLAHGAILLAVALVVATRNLTGAGNTNFVVIEALLGVWFLIAFALQWAQQQEDRKNAALTAWVVLDALFITTLICLSEPPRETLLAAYPALIAASGLWVRERLVAAAACACLAGYAALLWLSPELAQPLHHAIIFAALLVVTALVVGFQVRRLRVLNQFL